MHARPLNTDVVLRGSFVSINRLNTL